MSEDVEILLTPKGQRKLKQRLDHLRNVQRPDVADRLRESKQFGEISENPEYEDAKQEQALVESQILELERLLQVAQTLNPDDIPTDHAGLGSTVKLVAHDGSDEWELTLVSSIEADPDTDYISDESPVGEALMGKTVGEQVLIHAPDGLLRYVVHSIRKELN